MAATAITAALITSLSAALPSPANRRTRLDAQPLPLTANRFTQVAELRFDDVGHRLACGVHNVADLIAHGIHGDLAPELTATLSGPACTALAALSRPSRRTDRGTTGGPGDRREWSSAGRSASKQERRARADHGAQCRGR